MVPAARTGSQSPPLSHGMVPHGLGLDRVIPRFARRRGSAWAGRTNHFHSGGGRGGPISTAGGGGVPYHSPWGGGAFANR